MAGWMVCGLVYMDFAVSRVWHQSIGFVFCCALLFEQVLQGAPVNMNYG